MSDGVSVTEERRHPLQLLEALLISTAVVVGLEIAAMLVGHIPNSSVIFSIIIVFLTLTRGTPAGLVCGAVTLLYVCWRALWPDQELTADEATRLTVVALAIPGLTLLTSVLRRRSEQAIAVLRSEISTRLRNESQLRAEIAARIEVEEALRRTEAEYRNLFEHNPNPMWIFDRETLRFLAVNDVAVTHYGYTRDQFLAMTIADIRPPEDVPLLHDSMRENEAQPYTTPRRWRHRRADGSLIDVEIMSSKMSFHGREASFVLALDVTERRLLEEQVLQAQKMETVGRLAGGVAHDFNNLLTVIMGNIALMRDDLPSDHRLISDLDEVDSAAQRAADLTRQLLAFARKQVMLPQPVNINALTLDMERMLRRLIGEDIELRTLPAADLPLVIADPGQISQVLVNLVVNARDAMPEGGRMTIETGIAELDAHYAALHVDLQPGTYAMLAVSDSGLGIAPEHLTQIFEPFFTTKPQGQGTGLGLATCYGIAKQHGGHIAVYSEIGRGSTFRLYLPVATGEVATAASGQPTELPRGNETIMVAEDDNAVRLLATRVLREQGYRVIEATNGKEALQIAARLDTQLDLLFTDIVMPVIGGALIAEQLLVRWPQLRVLYTSGYTENVISHQGRLDPGVAYLPKPFTPAALARAVRHALDAPPAPLSSPAGDDNAG
jgi:hypothetical protein